MDTHTNTDTNNPINHTHSAEDLQVIKDEKICNLSYLPVSNENLDISIDKDETHIDRLNNLYGNITRFSNRIKDHIVLNEYLSFLNCINLNDSDYTDELNLIFRSIYHLPTIQLLYLYSFLQIFMHFMLHFTR